LTTKKPKTTRKRQVKEFKLKDARKRITPTKWNAFLAFLINGYTVPEARQAADIPPTAYKLVMLNDDEKREQRDKAIGEYYRAVWPDELVDDILVQVAEGSNLKDVLVESGPVELDNPRNSFYALLNNDDLLMDKYKAAQEIKMYGMADEIIEIADTDAEDTLIQADGKITSNPSAVRRSEVKIRTRQWLMEKVHHRQFGNKQMNEHKVQVVDQATVLEEARRRKSTGAEKHRARLAAGSESKPVTIEQEPEYLE
jgi:hypothetical protein